MVRTQLLDKGQKDRIAYKYKLKKRDLLHTTMFSL